MTDAAHPKCINCRDMKPCVLVEMSVLLFEEYRQMERIFICFGCLKSDDGTLGSYLASYVDRKNLPILENHRIVYTTNPLVLKKAKAKKKVKK